VWTGADLDNDGSAELIGREKLDGTLFVLPGPTVRAALAR
jgi:hypothetical protein